MFRAPIHDVYCGMRGFTKRLFYRHLRCTGMEFATEMIIKSSLFGQDIVEVPITLHPDGVPHGPHPGRTEQSLGQTETTELAVMLDTFRPLRVSRAALAIEDQDYFRSWIATDRS